MIGLYKDWQWCRQKRGPEPTMHTDVVGRVEARQWKHYSKGYVSRQGEAWYYLYYIFNRKDALGSIVLQRKADIYS